MSRTTTEGDARPAVREDGAPPILAFGEIRTCPVQNLGSLSPSASVALMQLTPGSPVSKVDRPVRRVVVIVPRAEADMARDRDPLDSLLFALNELVPCGCLPTHLSPEMKALWEAMESRTRYSLMFARQIARIRDLRDQVKIRPPRRFRQKPHNGASWRTFSAFCRHSMFSSTFIRHN